MNYKSKILTAAGLALAFLSAQSYAVPIITSEGAALGFTIDTVVSGMPAFSLSGYDVLGVAVNSDGNIVMNNAYNSTNYVFSDANNQTLSDAISSTSASGFPMAITNANGTLWASGGWNGSGTLQRLNNDGSVAAIFTGFGINNGMWTNPINNHIIATSSYGLIDIDVSDPNNPTYRTINGASTDGLTVSPDGTVVYTNSGAYNINDGSLIASYSVSGADGMGIIISNNGLNGDVIVSTTSGNLVLLDPTQNFAQTIIASGGGYGDYANTDTTTGTLLFSSGNTLGRLGCGQGCGIGSVAPPSSSVPEPASLALLGLGLIGLGFTRRKQA